MKKVAIIGNGVSAVTAVREFRNADTNLTIDVFSEEGVHYYPRPKLIDFIRGDIEKDDVIQYDASWYAKQNVNLRLSEPVLDIIPKSGSVLTKNDTYFGYDSILLAVGSNPFVPPIHGTEKGNVYTLRTLTDAISIKEATKGSGREIIVGGGILGIELAAAIRKAGGEPIVISNIGTLLPTQLDQGASQILMERLQGMGISVLLGFSCSQVLGHEVTTGVMSGDGDKVKGDLVVVATGIRPNTAIAKSAGLEIGKGRGVLVNEYMQTSEPNVFAAGDCTEWKGICWGIIPVAMDTAKVAAANMLELGSAEYGGTIPSNTLQVAGIDLTSVGIINPQSVEYESIVMADHEEGTYYKAVMKDHVVVGGIALGNRKVAMKLRKLIRDGIDVSDQRKEIFEV
ncbi:MAG: NAD(P)/FAD-dependent oxidoreductase [Candidatus Thorarchaeota archaeon]